MGAILGTDDQRERQVLAACCNVGFRFVTCHGALSRLALIITITHADCEAKDC